MFSIWDQEKIRDKYCIYVLEECDILVLVVVLVGMQTSTKSVSQMTERELRTEVAAVSLRIMELTSRLPAMNPVCYL